MTTTTVKKTNIETNPGALRQAMFSRLRRRTRLSGEIVFPCVPALLDHYATQLLAIFTAAGRHFTRAELEHLKTMMARQLAEGFAAAPYARLRICYETDAPPSLSLSYRIFTEISTMADQYQSWVETRTPPLFGSHPDAKLMTVLASLGGDPARQPVLDVGAGTGRNTIPVAQAGFPTDAVEPAPALAAELHKAVDAARVPVRIHESDFFDPTLMLPAAHYAVIVLAEVVSHFRSTAELKALFTRASALLRPGGLLLFSTFLPRKGFKPEALVRELAQVFWCSVFTRGELENAAHGCPLERVSDESVYEFEKAHLAPEAWPPVPWYAEWTSGQDLFDLPADKTPIEMRWLAYRKQA